MQMKDFSIFGTFPNRNTIPKKLQCSFLKICYVIPFSFGAYICETFAHVHSKPPSLEQYLGDS